MTTSIFEIKWIFWHRLDSSAVTPPSSAVGTWGWRRLQALLGTEGLKMVLKWTANHEV